MFKICFLSGSATGEFTLNFDFLNRLCYILIFPMNEKNDLLKYNHNNILKKQTYFNKVTNFYIKKQKHTFHIQIKVFCNANRILTAILTKQAIKTAYKIHLRCLDQILDVLSHSLRRHIYSKCTVFIDKQLNLYNINKYHTNVKK